MTTTTQATPTSDALAAVCTAERVAYLVDGEIHAGSLHDLAHAYEQNHYADFGLNLPSNVRVRWGAWSDDDIARVYFTRDDLIDPAADLGDLERHGEYGVAWATCKIDGRA